MKLIYENSHNGRHGFSLPKSDVPEQGYMDKKYCRALLPGLPEASELDVIRHFTNLSRRNFSVDANFYPLGSCTMKYNPKFTEKIAALDGFTATHPLLPQLSGSDGLADGSLEVIHNTERLLSEITGMAAFTTQPLAGAHGELTGVMIIAAYHKHQGSRKRHIIIPDSSHGTNPASAAIAGYDVIVIPTDKDGYMDIGAYKRSLNSETAAVMLTCPDTLGIFNPRIQEIARLAHEAGALMYYDGANLNAMLGKCRPGDIGFDVVHINLHKTFATPHGGGGPGAGPVGVCGKLVEYLPVPRVERRKDGKYSLNYNFGRSIGYIAPFYGNFGVVLKAYAYILALGKKGLIESSENAVLNANYIASRLKGHYQLAYDKLCMHECVFSALRQAAKGVHAIDIAKYLIDKGFHPPTVYFPLIVKEAIMIEPTETESKETLDTFIDAMIDAARLTETDPDRLHRAPVTTAVGRLDETKAAREVNVRWKAAL